MVYLINFILNSQRSITSLIISETFLSPDLCSTLEAAFLKQLMIYLFIYIFCLAMTDEHKTGKMIKSGHSFNQSHFHLLQFISVTSITQTCVSPSFFDSYCFRWTVNLRKRTQLIKNQLKNAANTRRRKTAFLVFFQLTY